MSIAAPTGFGKTMSALLIAFGITNDWSKITVIDSENESADLYEHLGPYNVISMHPPYNVDSFCDAVDMCIKNEQEVIIVDSTYHYWHGQGGLLDFVGSLGGKFTDWAKGSPLWARFLNKILQTPAHFICTSRKKQAYEISKGNDGKATVEKKGMEDQIRDGFDYEMTLAFDIISDKHMAKAQKDRTGIFMGKQEFIPTSQTGVVIKNWCESGAEPIQSTTPISAVAFAKAIERIEKGEINLIEKIKSTYFLTEDQIKSIDKLRPV